ncbi:MAG: hypothetical protein V4495_25620 [Pseudomonadota bacterium]
MLLASNAAATNPQDMLVSAAPAEPVWTKVANQYQRFALSAPQIVRYGQGTRWVEKQMNAGSVYCGDGTFGDPAPGAQKQCQIKVTAPDTPPVTGLSQACATYYGGIPNFALNTTRTDNMVIPALAKPGRGIALGEPSYKTCLLRASDYIADGLNERAFHAYSRVQAFNADSSKYLLLQNDGFWNVYDAKTQKLIKKLAPPLLSPHPASDRSEVQWDAKNPNLLTYTQAYGAGMKLYEFNVETADLKVVADLSARLKARWPDADAMTTMSEGSPSKDGRYYCYMLIDKAGQMRGLFTWDRTNDVITGTRDYTNRPDHVSMSPSGNYCVISNFDPVNTVAFSRDFSTSKQIVKYTTHYDLAIDANGDDVFVGVDPVSYPWPSENHEGDVFMYNLRTGQRTNLGINSYEGGTNAMHFSGRGFNKPGWFVLSTQASTKARWFDERIMAIELKANPRIYNLAFHRSKYTVDVTAPVASVNRDFTKIIFNSNWGSGSIHTDAYFIELPANALTGASASSAASQ